MCSLGEQEPLLFWDDTYEMQVYNTVMKQKVGTLPHSSFLLKVMLCIETKLFVGTSSGEIFMYDAFTLELLGKVSTNRQAVPLSMC